MWEAVLGEERAPTVIVGHSMGGAIATWAASLKVSICHFTLITCITSLLDTPAQQCLAVVQGNLVTGMALRERDKQTTLGHVEKLSALGPRDHFVVAG